MSSRCSEVLAEVRATIESELALLRRDEGRSLTLLDIGCWDGAPTARYRELLGGRAHGVEVFAEQAARARGRGVEVAEIDLETQRLPWPDAAFDVVVANQVFEHLKNIWLPMAEIARVLTPGGHLVFSVPNLASLHNRAMLAAGLQPSSIRTFGPHVRGFTYRQTRQYLALDGFFEIRRVRGVGFYPLPVPIARPLARLWVGGSHTPVLVATRRAQASVVPPWLALSDDGEQTYYAPGQVAASEGA